MNLSKDSLDILNALFSDKSTLKLPICLATQMVEIRQWIDEKLTEVTPIG